jgi:hypothetical protein
MRRRGEGLVDRRRIAGAPQKAQVARHALGDLRGVRCAGRGGVRQRGQRLGVDADRFGGVERLIAAKGDDQRHRLAGIADLALRQQGLRQEGEFLAGLRVGLGRRPQWQKPVDARLRRGQDGQHARHRPRRRRADAAEPGMGMRRTQHDGVDETREGKIVEIAAAAGQKPGVFAALRRRTDACAGRRHRRPPLARISQRVGASGPCI